MSVSQALVLSAMQHIAEGEPVPGKEVSGERTVVLTAAEREEVLRVLDRFVREPAFHSPMELNYRASWIR